MANLKEEINKLRRELEIKEAYLKQIEMRKLNSFQHNYNTIDSLMKIKEQKITHESGYGNDKADIVARTQDIALVPILKAILKIFNDLNTRIQDLETEINKENENDDGGGSHRSQRSARTLKSG